MTSPLPSLPIGCFFSGLPFGPGVGNNRHWFMLTPLMNSLLYCGCTGVIETHLWTWANGEGSDVHNFLNIAHSYPGCNTKDIFVIIFFILQHCYLIFQQPPKPPITSLGHMHPTVVEGVAMVAHLIYTAPHLRLCLASHPPLLGCCQSIALMSWCWIWMVAPSTNWQQHIPTMATVIWALVSRLALLVLQLFTGGSYVPMF